MNRLRAALAALVLTVAGAVPALAGPPNTIDVVTADPQFAGTIEVAWTSNLKTPPPIIGYAECSQDGERVYAQYIFLSRGETTFTLGPTPSWLGGDADCEVQLGQFGNNGFHARARDTFTASG